MISGLRTMMETPGLKNEVFNVGRQHEVEILELAEAVLDITGSESEIVYKPLPEDDPQRRQPDINRAKNALGWNPEVPLREGLKRTIDYFRTHEREV
jgi:UDP-glucuronate decarboxylase